jgi:putative tricarboxylic transport membrane protein
MKSKSLPDLALGLIFALSGAFILSQALAIRGMPGMPVGPGLFPTITGIGMMVFGALLAFQAWFAPASEANVVVPEADAPQALDTQSSLLNPFSLGILACVVASIVLIPILGFLIAGTLVTFAVVLLGRGRLLTALIFAPVATGLIYAAFVYGFRVPLPHGLLG